MALHILVLVCLFKSRVLTAAGFLRGSQKLRCLGGALIQNRAPQVSRWGHLPRIAPSALAAVFRKESHFLQTNQAVLFQWLNFKQENCTQFPIKGGTDR